MLVAESMFVVCAAACELILEQGLLERRRPVILTDGGVDIRT